MGVCPLSRGLGDTAFKTWKEHTWGAQAKRLQRRRARKIAAGKSRDDGSEESSDGEVEVEDDGLPAFVADLMTAEPETRIVAMAAGDEFMILACDGLWSVMSSQEACDYVRAGLSKSKRLDRQTLSRLAVALAEEAIRRDNFDNTTVIIVRFGGSGMTRESDILEQATEAARQFRMFDSDGDGMISVQELHKLFDELGSQRSKDVIDAMTAQLDRHATGRIRYDEFVHWIFGVLPI